MNVHRIGGTGTAALWSLLVAGAGSCTGVVEGPAGGAGGGETAGPTGGGGGRGPAPLHPSPDTPLLRLTRTEYSNTLRDLLGDTRRSGNALDADPTSAGGFDKNATELASVSPPLDQYDAVAANALDGAFTASASRGKLLGGCDPVTAACAHQVVSRFLRRAWRRPVTDDEVSALWEAGALKAVTAQGDGLEEGVKLAFRMALDAPSFLYRVETDPPAGTGLHPVTPHELATRLSYFVWSSMPDDDLFAAAAASAQANLARPSVFAAQLARMLGDGKAAALREDFAAQWLTTRGLAFVSPNATSAGLSAWKDSLRDPMVRETQLFFEAFLKSDQNVVDLLDADFTFVNDALAKFYGLPPVSGSEMRQIAVAPDASHRFGLLSQAAILTVTSNPDRTNIPKRGKWVLTNLLCSPPPPPPANVPPLPDAGKSGLPKNASLKQRLDAHIANPACAGCHQVIDGPGFALEHYNAIGLWRDTYPAGVRIEAGGTLGAETYDGAQELSRALKRDPRFGRCVASKLYSYALGRDPQGPGDEEAIARLTEDFASRGGRMRDLVALIATTPAFQLRGGTP